MQGQLQIICMLIHLYMATKNISRFVLASYHFDTAALPQPQPVACVWGRSVCLSNQRQIRKHTSLITNVTNHNSLLSSLARDCCSIQMCSFCNQTVNFFMTHWQQPAFCYWAKSMSVLNSRGECWNRTQWNTCSSQSLSGVWSVLLLPLLPLPKLSGQYESTRSKMWSE